MKLTIDGDPRKLTPAQVETIFRMAGRPFDSDDRIDAVNIWVNFHNDDMASFEWRAAGRFVICGGILADGSSHT